MPYTTSPKDNMYIAKSLQNSSDDRSNTNNKIPVSADIMNYMDKVKIHKMTRFILTGAIILIVLLITVAVKYNYKNTNNNTDFSNQAITPTPTSTSIRNQEKLGKRLKPIMSPSGKLSAFLSIEDNNVLRLQILSADDGLFRILREGEELTTDTSTDLLEQQILEKDAEYINYVLGEFWNYPNPMYSIAAISPNDDSLALILPNKIIVVLFETNLETINNQKHTYSAPTLKITEKFELPINLFTDEYFYPQVFYSNEGNILFFSNRSINNSDWAYKFNLTNQVAESINQITPREIYPLNNSDGLVYWGKPDQIVDRNELDFITFDYGNSQKTINILDNRQNPNIGSYDYSGFITVNSNHTGLCAERGASGYWGYIVGRVSGNQFITLDTGNQYSYCKGWLNNNEVILEEKPYHNQFIKKTFLYNIQTQEKKLILVEENKNF